MVNNTINFNKLFVPERCYANDVQNKVKNKFWIDVLRAYSDILQLNGENTEYCILSSPIFHDNSITISSKPIYIKYWDQKGGKIINDLVHATGEFLSQDEFDHAFNIKTILFNTSA